MTEVISVLMVLAGLAFLLQVTLERVKSIVPILGGSYSFTIKGVEFKIAPMQYLSLIVGIGLMFIINQPISLFGALGFEVPNWTNHIINGIILSGGSSYIYEIVRKLEEKKSINKEELE